MLRPDAARESRLFLSSAFVCFSRARVSNRVKTREELEGHRRRYERTSLGRLGDTRGYTDASANYTSRVNILHTRCYERAGCFPTGIFRFRRRAEDAPWQTVRFDALASIDPRESVSLSEHFAHGSAREIYSRRRRPRTITKYRDYESFMDGDADRALRRN